mgnify:CR=1 FL=1
MINGVVVGLEEQRALGKEEIDDDFVNGLKVGLMGPLAGIGDSMIPGMLIPILLSIGIGIVRKKGSILGPIFYIVAYNTIIMLGSRFLFLKAMNWELSPLILLSEKKRNRLRKLFQF